MDNVVVLKPANPREYYERLGSSLEDKLFFLDRIPSDVTVFADFGCGSGDILQEVAKRRRNVTHTIGYDLMRECLPSSSESSNYWTPDMGLFTARIQAHVKAGHKVCLILSSVVHEVLSQGTSWFRFWDFIRSLGCDYIAIRDMGCELDATYTKPTNAEELALLSDPKMADVFIYGTEGELSFKNRAAMLQGLLKYRYGPDLMKELDEDYFALTSEQWLNLTSVGSGYQVSLFDHHSVPWHRECWKRDFGLDIEDKTHVKIILKKV